MRTMHNLQEASTMENAARDIPKIYGTLDNRHEEHCVAT